MRSGNAEGLLKTMEMTDKREVSARRLKLLTHRCYQEASIFAFLRLWPEG